MHQHPPPLAARRRCLLFGVTLSRHLSSLRFRPEDHIRAPDSTFRLSRFRVLGQISEHNLNSLSLLTGPVIFQSFNGSTEFAPGSESASLIDADSSGGSHRVWESATVKNNKSRITSVAS